MTIPEIKKSMTDMFIQNDDVRNKYGLKDGLTFEDQFSTVSIENILFFIVATCMWVNQQLFSQHKIDIQQLLNEQKAHTSNWYAHMAKQFQFGQDLVAETDRYDNTGLTSEEVEKRRVVKYSAAVESLDKTILYLKIATDSNGVRQPLPNNQLTAFKAYINTIQDVGVRIQVINDQADDMRLIIDIYYDSLILDQDGKQLDGENDSPVQSAIRNYLNNLPFNGTYTNQGLIDVLQNLNGVEVAELKSAASRYGYYTEYTEIDAREIPHAGYYKISDSNLILNFIPNEEIL